MSTPTAPPRGMRDLLPEEVRLRDRAAAVIQASYERFGFAHIETPALEHIGWLTSGEGGDNEKLIYKVLKRGAKLDLEAAGGEDDLVDFGLRYDLTVPLARFYAANQGQLPNPFKALQMGPVWRAERPQKGRYRQFTQCDIDVLGDATVFAEVELLAATTATLADLGLDDTVVRVNDRRLLTALVTGCGFPAERTGAVLISLDKLDKLGLDGVAEDLGKTGFEAAPIAAVTALLSEAGDDLEAFVARLPADDGVAEARQRLATLLSSLPSERKVVFDPTLVRGMGYYTGPIFEVVREGLGYSLAGGGRYDEMIGRMQGRPVPACGISIGFERVVLELQAQADAAGGPRRIALLHEADDPPAALLAWCDERRAAGEVATLYRRRKNAKAQLSELAAAGFDGYARFRTDGPVEVQDLRA